MNILKLFARARKPLKMVSAKSQRWEVLLSGSGGQGMILAGRILAEAATIYGQKRAVMTQSYGPEARGGASRAEVIISEREIIYPKVIKADILLAMTQPALDKYGKLLSPGGLLIVDSTFINKVPSQFKNVFKSPFSSLAIKFLDASIVANVIALGVLACIAKVVTRESLIQAVLAIVYDKAVVLDRVAVDIGYKLAEDNNFQWERQT